MIEEWKPVVGFEDYFLISNMGNVFGLRSSKIIKTQVHKNGRENFSTRIGGRKGKVYCFKVHRLVAEAFISNPDNKRTVNHKDGNPLNNAVNNLEWHTQSENIRHAFDNGLITPLKGEKNTRAKLSWLIVEDIRGRYVPYCKINGASALSRLYGVDKSTVLKVVSNKTWL
jgi:hypothetical protein